MKSTRFLTAKRALAALIVALSTTLILAPAAQAADTFKILHQFKGGKDGSQPNNTLVMDSTGNLYGTTVHGGKHGQGSVFELTPNANGTWTLHPLYSFNTHHDGSQPFSEVIFDTSGNLYGVTYSGGKHGQGIVFKLAPKSGGKWAERVLHSFTGKDGSSPLEAPTIDTTGNFYGKTWSGGTHNMGVVYKLAPQSKGGWAYSVLHNFAGGQDGSTPDRGPLVLDASGNVYGITGGGGAGSCNGHWGAGCGVVFELTPQASGKWKETVIYHFQGGSDGAVGQGLTFDQAGTTLYGVTAMGGTGSCSYTIPGCGTVFSLTPNGQGGWTEQVLYSFNSSDGANPWASPVFDGAGNLYGTTLTGGNAGCGEWMNNGCGTVFELTPNSGGWTQQVLYDLPEKASHPFAGVILDSQGNIYGDAEDPTGAIFEISP